MNNHSELSQDHLLNHSKVFCIYPWTHLSVNPVGDVAACCDSTQLVGNSKTHTLEQIWNHDAMKLLRKNILNSEQVSNCTRCYQAEQSGFESLRIRSNKKFAQHISLINNTKSDGALEQFRLRKIDVRFSNLCNLKCRTCHHYCSSSWYQDHVSLVGQDYTKQHKALLFAGRHETDIWEQLVPHLDYVEEIHFAGGEPLMMEQHYQILDHLVSLNKLDVKLLYSTNFTTLQYKDRFIFDYWKKFRNVQVNGSFDDMHARGEYIRKGINWNDIEASRRQMIAEIPDTPFYVAATLSIFNVFSLPDFHRNWVDRGLIPISNFFISQLTHPDYIRADILSSNLRKIVEEKYLQHIDWLTANNASPACIGYFQGVINFITQSDSSRLIGKFWKRTTELDALRKEDFLQTFPELRLLR